MAKVRIDYVANTEKFNAELNEATRQSDKLEDSAKGVGDAFDEAADEAEKLGDEVNETSKKGSKLGDTMKKVGGLIAAAFAVGAIIAFTKASVAAFDVQAKGEAKLLAALKGRRAVQERLIKQAGIIQKQTLFGDEEIINQQAFLANLQFTEKEINNIIAASVDLAAANDNLTLESSVLNLAKTYSGLSGELGELIPQLRVLTAEQLKAGEGVELVRKQFEGQAKVVAGVGSGSIVQFTNLMGDLREAVGSLITRAINPLVRGVGVVVNNLTAFVSRFGDTRTAVQRTTDDLIALRTEFNLEIEVLTKANIPQEERAKLIKQINTEYKDYLPNLIDEKSSLEEIATIQEEANRLFRARIAFVAFEDELAQAIKARVVQQRASIDAVKEQVRAQKELTEIGASPGQVQAAIDVLDQFIDKTGVSADALEEEVVNINEAFTQIFSDLGFTMEEIQDLFGETTTVITKSTDLNAAALAALAEKEAQLLEKTFLERQKIGLSERAFAEQELLRLFERLEEEARATGASADEIEQIQISKFDALSSLANEFGAEDKERNDERLADAQKVQDDLFQFIFDGSTRAQEVREQDLANQQEAEDRSLEITRETQRQRTDIAIMAGEQLAEASANIFEILSKSDADFTEDTLTRREELNAALALLAIQSARQAVAIAAPIILANQVAQGGFIGIATAAVLIGIVTGALIAAENKIKANMFEGTEFLTGDRGRDQIPINANYGERIVDTRTNKQLKGIKNKELPEAVALFKMIRSSNGIDLSALMSLQGLTNANKSIGSFGMENIIVNNNFTDKRIVKGLKNVSDRLDALSQQDAMMRTPVSRFQSPRA